MCASCRPHRARRRRAPSTWPVPAMQGALGCLSRAARVARPSAAPRLPALSVRKLCAAAAAADAPPRRPKKVRAPDLPHVVRRRAYLRDMTRARISFRAEAVEGAATGAAAAAVARHAGAADVAERSAVRGARAEEAYAAALRRRADQAVRREENRARGVAHLEAWNAQIDERKMSRVAALNAAAPDWVTEANLAEKVDDLLDQWFINSEAASHALRGTPGHDRPARGAS
jgi:hypothetical protein